METKDSPLTKQLTSQAKKFFDAYSKATEAEFVEALEKLLDETHEDGYSCSMRPPVPSPGIEVLEIHAGGQYSYDVGTSGSRTTGPKRNP